MKQEWEKIVEYILGSISIIGSFFIILVFFTHKSIRSFAFESVVYLTVSSMMTTISYIIYYINPEDGGVVDEKLCKIQAFAMIMFENSQYLLATIIGYSVYKSVIHFEESQERSDCIRRVLYLFTGYFVPFSLALICYQEDVLGPSGRWCWIDTTENKPKKIIYASIFYSLVWIMILFNFILTCRTLRYLNQHFTTHEEREMIRGYMWKLLRYPLIQLICIFPGSVNRFIQVVFDRDIYEIQFIQLIFTLLQGLFFAIAYGYTSQVKTALLDTMRTYCYCFFCFKKRSSVGSSSVSSQRLCDRASNPSENTTFDE